MGQVTVLSQDQCRKELGEYMAPEQHSGMFCGKGHRQTDTHRSDACQGDSGGALICTSAGGFHVTGIISYGSGCGSAELPGVYTSVYYHNKWIQNILDTK